MLKTQYDWRFYEVLYNHVVGKEIIQQDTIYLYSNGGPLSSDHIKQQVSDLLKNPSAVITLPFMKEIEHTEYVEKTGKDPKAKYM